MQESLTPHIPLNIKENVCNFLKESLFASLKTVAGVQKEVNIFMLVVDGETSLILNSFIQYTDLIDCGIAGIERLELIRKPFPDLHAIYMLTPTRENIQKLAKDFENDKIQYGLIHLIFRNAIDESLIDYLMTFDESLLNRIVNIKEFRLDFDVLDESSFTLEMKDTLSLMTPDKETARLEKAEEIGQKIASIVTALSDVWNVQIVFNESESGVAGIAANSAKRHLESYLSHKGKKPVHVPAPVTFVIMERSLDMLTPLRHDFYYNSLLMDILNIRNNTSKHEAINEKQEKYEKISKLNENDSIWMKFRGRPFFEALKTIVSDFNDFIKNNSAAKLQAGEIEDMNIDKMGKIIREMPAYQDMMSEYSFHIGMLELAGPFYRERGMESIIDTEQSLCCGMDRKLKNSTKISTIKPLKDTIVTLDRIRLALMMLISEHSSPRLHNEVFSLLDDEGRKLLTLIKKFGIEECTQSIPAKNPDDWSTGISLELDRSISKISECIIKLKTGKETPGWGRIVLPEAEEFPSIKVRAGRMIANTMGGDRNKEVLPIFIPFVIGGISVNEIRELRTLDSSKMFGGHTSLPGGTIQFTASGFIEELKRIDGPLPEDIIAAKELHKFLNPPPPQIEPDNDEEDNTLLEKVDMDKKKEDLDETPNI